MNGRNQDLGYRFFEPLKREVLSIRQYMEINYSSIELNFVEVVVHHKSIDKAQKYLQNQLQHYSHEDESYSSLISVLKFSHHSLRCVSQKQAALPKPMFYLVNEILEDGYSKEMKWVKCEFDWLSHTAHFELKNPKGKLHILSKYIQIQLKDFPYLLIKFNENSTTVEIHKSYYSTLNKTLEEILKTKFPHLKMQSEEIFSVVDFSGYQCENSGVISQSQYDPMLCGNDQEKETGKKCPTPW